MVVQNGQRQMAFSGDASSRIVVVRLPTACWAAIAGICLYGGLLFAIVYGRVFHCLPDAGGPLINQYDYIWTARVWLAASVMGILPSVAALLAVRVMTGSHTALAWAVVVLASAGSALIQSLLLAVSAVQWPYAAVGALTGALLYPAVHRTARWGGSMDCARWVLPGAAILSNGVILFFYLLALMPLMQRWLGA